MKLSLHLRVVCAIIFLGLFSGATFASAQTPPAVVINEFSSNGGSDWVELLNTTGSSIDLSGWYLVVIAGSPATTTLSGTLPANGILTFAPALNDAGAVINLQQGNTIIQSVPYGSADGAVVTAPGAGQSAAFTSPSTWANGTPTKGWFNGSPAPTIASIVSGINGGGVTTNWGTSGIPDSSAATGLYFEKTGRGRVTFTATLNLTDASTTAFLQNLGTYMDASAGSVKFDARTATQLKDAGAEIKMYGLDALGYTDAPSIIVKDDDGNVISGASIVSGVSYAAGTLTFTAAHFTQFNVDNNIYVATSTGDDTTGDGTQGHPYKTIAKGITAVPTGGTVHVAAGTYNESVLINKSITLVGASGTNITGTSTANTNYILKIDGVSGGATINGLTIDGGATTSPHLFVYGILVNNSGTSGTPVEIKNSTIKDVWTYDGSSNAGVEVDATSVGGSYALIDNNTISLFQKRGVRFINSSGKIYSNEIIGHGVDGTSEVQNLINLWGGSTAEVYGNKLHNALTTGTMPTWDSVGVLVTAYGGSGASTANIHDNEIYSDDAGVIVGSVYVSGDDTSSTTISNNNFHDLATAVSFEKDTITATLHGNLFSTTSVGITADQATGSTTQATIDATQNWWGAVSGPKNATTNANGTGATIYNKVSFSPWFSDENKTILAYTTSTSTATTTATTGSDDTTMTGTSTESGGDVDVTAEIPAGTTITGDSSWDGTVQAPTATTATVSISGFNTNVTSAVTIGSSDSDLTFDKAVKLTFAGQTGQHIGWYNHAGTFTEITDICSVNTQTAGNALAAGGSCKFDTGVDMIVWTKHFSTFVTYTQTAVSSGGGGGGGGPVGLIGTTNGGGGGVGAAVIPTVPAGAGGGTGTGTGGEVLGASAYNFTRALSVGSRGADVTALQQFLIDSGYSIPAGATGYFGAQTGAAVIAFQKAHGLAQVGVVGPLTRALLNRGITPTTPEVSGAVYTFARALSVGSTGTDVTALQNLLAKISGYTGPVTGYFGTLTKAAVVKYQTEHNISAIGIVGPLTRASLNGGAQ